MVSFGTLRLIYLAHVHSIMNCGIILWAGSSCAKKVFILQKRIIRIITNTKPRDPCREIFKKLEIMPFYSQYIYNNSVVFESASKLYRSSDRRRSAKLVPTLADRGCHVVSATSPSDCNFDFLDILLCVINNKGVFNFNIDMHK
jgi:hypothetical protein